MINNIFKPYVYVIKHIPTGKYYIGVKIAKNSNPDMFWVEGGYFTSSKIVKKLRDIDGDDSFIIDRIKTFSTSNEAYSYETRLLKKVKVLTNEKFLNNSDNTNVSPFGTKKYNDMMLEKYGVENSSKMQSVKNKKKETLMERYGVDHQLKVPEFEESRKKTIFERYGVENISQNKEIVDKKKQTSLKKYGVSNYNKTDLAKKKRASVNHEKSSRPLVSEVREIHKEKKLKLPECFHMFSDEKLTVLLHQVKNT